MSTALLIAPEPGAGREFLLGLPLALRAALSAVQAGASTIQVRAEADAAVLDDPRLAAAVELVAAPSGELLVLRADAVVAPAVLRELSLGEAVRDAEGQWLAARLVIDAGDLEAALAASTATRVEPDRYHFAMRVADSAGRAQASSALFGALVKPSDGPVSRHFNRHFSRAVTRLVLPLGMRPNQMTVFVGLAGVAGAWYASLPSYGAQVLGAFLYQVHSIIDGCDGEIARLTHRFGKHGALIDSVVDDACNALFFVGLSVGVGRMLGSDWPFWAGGLSALAYVLVAYLQYAVVLRQTGRGDKTSFWQAETQKVTLFGVLRALLRRDVFVLLIFGIVVFGLAPVMVAIFPLAAIGTLVATASKARA